MANRKLPFGYRIRGGQVQIAEREADTVHMIFDRYIAGIFYDRLASELNGQDIRYIPGKPWNKNMVAPDSPGRTVPGRLHIPSNYHT